MLAEKIAENIEKHKDKIALWDKDKAISYGKLGDVINLNLDRINTVGNVGILTSHSSEGIIAELICLFLNKTFIPIVDNLPTFRIEKMIEISNITGIIIATEDKRVVQDLKEKYPKLDFFSIRKNGSVKKMFSCLKFIMKFLTICITYILRVLQESLKQLSRQKSQFIILQHNILRD